MPFLPQKILLSTDQSTFLQDIITCSLKIGTNHSESIFTRSDQDRITWPHTRLQDSIINKVILIEMIYSLLIPFSRTDDWVNVTI